MIWRKMKWETARNSINKKVKIPLAPTRTERSIMRFWWGGNAHDVIRALITRKSGDSVCAWINSAKHLAKSSEVRYNDNISISNCFLAIRVFRLHSVWEYLLSGAFLFLLPLFNKRHRTSFAEEWTFRPPLQFNILTPIESQRHSEKEISLGAFFI